VKFRLTFKTPNATDAIVDQLDAEYNDDSEEKQEMKEAMEDVAEKFVEYDEYVTIEFDTDGQSATVVPLRKR
jgi:hypothetical protein